MLDELKRWTTYRIWVLAGTSVGDGPSSFPITVRTHEDGTCEFLIPSKYKNGERFVKKKKKLRFSSGGTGTRRASPRKYTPSVYFETDGSASVSPHPSIIINVLPQLTADEKGVLSVKQ